MCLTGGVEIGDVAVGPHPTRGTDRVVGARGCEKERHKSVAKKKKKRRANMHFDPP